MSNEGATGPVAEPSKDWILSVFNAEHGEHYDVFEPLGEGESGFTHRALDKRRDIDVCLKFFKTGNPPVGARRDWRITSSVKHPLVADTFTVEHFRPDESGPLYVAVVSRLIKGKDLGYFIDKYRLLESNQQSALRDSMVRAIGDDLCSAVRACHDSGHGHGDLSERNVMISQGNSDLTFSATIIDFDNATYKAELCDLVETRLMERDVRALARLIGMLTLDTRWHSGLQELLQGCETSQRIQEALEYTRMITRSIDGDSETAYDGAHWTFVLERSIPFQMVGHGPEIEGFIQQVAADVGQTDALDAARNAINDRFENDPNYPQVSISISSPQTILEESARSLLE